MRTPPGVSASDFSTAVEKFAQAVGKEWVFTSDEDLDLYRDDYSVYKGEKQEYVASAALGPDKVEQVQAIVVIANQYKIPLYPISTGRNLGYGGSAPSYSGSVVLDLKRMNRVVEVNEKLQWALVEAGCSFFDLYHHLQSQNIRLYPSVPAPGWGSPVGNALDHGVGNPARDNFKNHCGLEVVLPNGELLRTGMGALPNAQCWQTYHYGFGPYLDGIFSQSNFGIVTKMGTNLFREPELTHTVRFSSRNHDDLDRLVEIAQYMESTGITPGGTGVTSPLMSSRDKDVMALIQSAGGGTAQQWNKMAGDKNLDVYSMSVQFRGATKVVPAQIETAKDLFLAIPGVEFHDGPSWKAPLDLDKIDEPDKGQFGIPTLWRFYPDLAQNKDPDWTGHVWFSPNVPQTGEAVRKANRVFQEGVQKFGLYWGWSGGIPFFPKNYTLLYAFESGGGEEGNKKTRDGFQLLVKIAAENGWSEYRSAPAFYDTIMNVLSYNNYSLRRFCETIKDAIDPNGIISPGRYAIWPKHLRGGARA